MLPLSIGGYDGFLRFRSILKPNSRIDFEEENLEQLLEVISREKSSTPTYQCCVSLTIDIWTSIQIIGYICVSHASLINEDWKMHKNYQFHFHKSITHKCC
jgi:hypothetical protein